MTTRWLEGWLLVGVTCAYFGCERDNAESTKAEKTGETEKVAKTERGTKSQTKRASGVQPASMRQTGTSSDWPKLDPGADESARVDRAVALLQPTQGSEARGKITFESAGDEAVKVEAVVDGLPPGKHAYHIHLLGDCSAPDGKSAGTHFNFHGPSKNPPKGIKRITGNLGELDADAKGHASHSDTIEASLTGSYSIIGRAVIVHEKPNDSSEPPIGAAGARLACGVIGLTD